MDAKSPLTILRRKLVEQRTGLSRSTIYGKIKFDPKRPHEYDPTFPLPITLGNNAKAVGWIESEIDAWLNAQIENSCKTSTHEELRAQCRAAAARKSNKTAPLASERR